MKGLHNGIREEDEMSQWSQSVLFTFLSNMSSNDAVVENFHVYSRKDSMKSWNISLGLKRHNISCKTMFYVTDDIPTRIIENRPMSDERQQRFELIFLKFDVDSLEIKFLNTDLYGNMPLNTDSNRPLHSCVLSKMSPERCIDSLCDLNFSIVISLAGLILGTDGRREQWKKIKLMSATRLKLHACIYLRIFVSRVEG